MIIKPTVGRVVWFTPARVDTDFDLGAYSPPFAAHVAYVWSENCVNLMVIGPEGHTLRYTSVTLIQADEPKPTLGRYCEWMPYQVGQAKKHEPTAAELGAAARPPGEPPLGKI